MLRVALILALTVRVLLIAAAYAQRGDAPFVAPDSWSYLQGAFSIATDFTFRGENGSPELFRTPGYPLLLVPAMLLQQPVLVGLALNLLLMVGIILLTHRLALRLTNERIAGFCAVAVAIEPTLMTWSMKLMPETLLTCCLLLFAVAVPKHPLAAAVALCAAAYVKPIVFPLVLVLAVAALFVRPRFALACLALLAPWHLRNYAVAGYGGFSTVVERTAYLSAGGAVAADDANVSHAEMRLRMLPRADGTAPEQLRREGLALVAAHPLRYAAIHAKGMARTLFDPGAVEYLRMLGIYGEGGRAFLERSGFLATARAYPLEVALSIALAAVLLPLIVLAAAGAVRGWRNPQIVLLAVLAGYLLVAGGGVHGYHRFRVPAVPFLLLLASSTLRRNDVSGRRSVPGPRVGGDRDDVSALAGGGAAPAACGSQ
ncbi:MAG TPA: hypothetical protein VF618_06975 [Thermoanaerobaculia bacterium]